MTNNDTFRITYFAKKHGKHITSNAKWTEICKEFISQKGVACMVYLDLDADGYRTATGKWSIKWMQFYTRFISRYISQWYS